MSYFVVNLNENVVYNILNSVSILLGKNLFTKILNLRRVLQKEPKNIVLGSLKISLVLWTRTTRVTTFVNCTGNKHLNKKSEPKYYCNFFEQLDSKKWIYLKVNIVSPHLLCSGIPLSLNVLSWRMFSNNNFFFLNWIYHVLTIDTQNNHWQYSKTPSLPFL